MGLDTVNQQPSPSGEGKSVTDLVIADLQARREGGVKKYGTELKTNNGRIALIDLYQELLDALLYLRQHLEEQNNGK
jgi:ABC-type nitrate/sulfonate/bicarbonate transport system ATPase subunit